MINDLNLDSLRYTIINGEKFYSLKDVSVFVGYKTYSTKRVLQGVDACFIKQAPLKENKTGRKFICVSIKGLIQILKRLDSEKINKVKTYSKVEKENIARKYGWSYGFVTAHISCGDLERQIEYAEKYCKPKKEIKRYDKRGFLHQSFMQ